MSSFLMRLGNGFYRRVGKRVFDLVTIMLISIPAVLLLTITSLLVRGYLGRPVLFKQERPGLYGQSFTLHKFRTMTNARDQDGKLLPDVERFTKLGQFLRSTSLDELPELWNVLKGDMSLVGPRPLRVSYLPLYTIEQAHRHDVLPGITGWAQVNGRNATTWADRFQHDLYYVEHQSFSLDLQIIFRTVGSVLRRDGIQQTESVPMAPFLGTEEQ